MRKLLLVLALLAFLPTSGEPVWGQPPSVGEQKTGSKEKQNTNLSQAQPNTYQRGTKDTPVFVQSLSDEEGKQKAAEAKAEEQRKANIDGWALGVAGLVAFFTLLLVIVGWRGVNAANRTLKAVEKQAALLEQQVNDARANNVSNAEIATGTLKAIKDQAIQMKEQAGLLERQANLMDASNLNARLALEATNANAKLALDASISAARNEYRPWIVFIPSLLSLPGAHTQDSTPPESPPPMTLKPNEGFVGRVMLKNIGRSPARQVVARILVLYGEPRSPKQINDFGERGFHAAVSDTSIPREKNTIAPMDVRGVFSNIALGLPEDRVENISKGIGMILLAGEITYLDSENGIHRTEVCVLFSGPNLERFANCGVRFDMD